jgi:hypothetical protein
VTSPFVLALGDRLDRLAPAVRDHLRQGAGGSLLEGRVRDSWRRGGPLGWLLAAILRVDFRATGASSPFELRNELLPGDAMLWRRTLRGERATIENVGVMRWDARRGALVDAIGRRGAIEVELVPAVDGAALALASRRQWLRVAGVRIRLPRWLAGSASVREREEAHGGIALRLELRHPWLGAYAGYEAELAEPAR